MKKSLLTILSILLSVCATWAQDISVGTASISKTDRPVVKAEYAVPSSILEEALEDKLNGESIDRGKRVKGGFRVYKGVSIPAISDDKLDIYTKIDGRKDNATLYVAVSRGYDNFISTESDPEMIEKVKAYVSSMIVNVDIAKIKVDIASQAKVVNNADKSKSNLVKVGEKLVSEQKGLEDKLADNKKEQEKNKSDQADAINKLQEEEAVLSELKSQLEMMVR